MQHEHLGDLLVRHGVMTPVQRDEVLSAQRTRGGPFGVIAEEMFGVSPKAVEEAWAEQYASFTPKIDPRRHHIDPRALEIVSRRQAWQFKIMPLELRGEGLLACTTQEHLVRSMRFAGWRLGHLCQFLLCEPMQLGEVLCEHYPMAGMTPGSVSERLLA